MKLILITVELKMIIKKTGQKNCPVLDN